MRDLVTGFMKSRSDPGETQRILFEKAEFEKQCLLTLFGMGFFMYAKGMGGGGKNYPPTLTFEPKELQC